MEIAESVLDLIGETPLVTLGRISAGLSTPVIAKLELFNPGGSVKDRPALAMIDDAERRGLLAPGGTIIEPTSGNTGVGLAIVAAQRGYRCIFVTTDKVAPEKISMLSAYGAEVVVCPVAVPPEDPQSYYRTAERLLDEHPGAYQPSQYSNPVNPQSHYDTTGPELWRQTDGRISHFVAGIGTGGTICGVSRYLKEQNPAVRVIGTDPAGSVFSGGSGRPYLVEGVGEDFWPATYDPDLVDEVIAITDEEAFITTRRVAHEEGLLIGGSCGLAVAGAMQVAARARPDDVVVVLLPDSGRGYLSRIFNDEWMARYGFLRSEGITIADVLAHKQGPTDSLIYVQPHHTGREAIGLMRKYSISQLPVAKGEMPVAAAEVMGSVQELLLMDRAFADASVLDMAVEDVMGPPMPTLGAGQPIEMAVEVLEGAPAVLVLSGGRPCDVITRADVLAFLSPDDVVERQ
jgi:cystathionine beta-synthase